MKILTFIVFGILITSCEPFSLEDVKIISVTYDKTFAGCQSTNYTTTIERCDNHVRTVVCGNLGKPGDIFKESFLA